MQTTVSPGTCTEQGRTSLVPGWSSSPGGGCRSLLDRLLDRPTLVAVGEPDGSGHDRHAACPVDGISEDHHLAPSRAKLTVRAAWWAISCIQRDNGSVASVASRLGVDWHTVWEAIKPLLEELADDPGRLAGVDILGVDEHIWHHQPRPGKGSKEIGIGPHQAKRETTRSATGPSARPLREGLRDWLRSAGPPGSGTATLDPFRGYGNAVRDEFDDAVAVLDAFHVVRLGLKAMEETRRRVQQQQLGHRGRKHDPLYRIRNPLRAGAERLSARQIERIEAGLQAGDPTFEVTVAWRCYQQLRSAFGASSLVEGRAVAVNVLDSFTCPIPEIARLGRTLRVWRDQFLAYFTTERATTEAPKPTASSNSTAASPAASATPQLPTTDDLGRRVTHPPESPMSR